MDWKGLGGVLESGKGQINIGIACLWLFLFYPTIKKKGDEERKRGLPISYLCDRYTVNTSKSQLGFIDVIVLPTYEVMKTFIPLLQDYIGNLHDNKNYWRERIEFYDEKLSKGVLLHD